MTSTATQLEKALAEVIRQQASQLNNVAIPGFGSFEGVKQDETIVDNPTVEGGRILMPPHVALRFTPSVILRKNLHKDESAH